MTNQDISATRRGYEAGGETRPALQKQAAVESGLPENSVDDRKLAVMTLGGGEFGKTAVAEAKGAARMRDCEARAICTTCTFHMHLERAPLPDALVPTLSGAQEMIMRLS